MSNRSRGPAIARRVVEVVAGLTMLSTGVVLQVYGSRPETQTVGLDAPLLIVGGILVAAGGIVLSWIVSSLFAERQLAEARQEARAEVDDKLDNLSRVLGQAAGQIAQAVELADSGQIPPPTGFALVSQANRIVYGQVNEISVIRGQGFDAAQLVDTAARLDDLARKLSGSSTANAELAETQREIKDIHSRLATATPLRQFGRVRVNCPSCATRNDVVLGSLPGDTAGPTCSGCHRPFNVHRTLDGSTIVRPHRAPSYAKAPAPAASHTPDGEPARKWAFNCPRCGLPLSAKFNDGSARLMVCPSCIAAVNVHPSAETATEQSQFRLVASTNFGKSGRRPKMRCPECNATIKSSIVIDNGFAAICVENELILTVTDEQFSGFLREWEAQREKPIDETQSA